ncbi:hypothetical protein [Clostridium sp. LP20]|uniref:hypothetical protein n=1 Tax=Clostridium sp. LP20 TaxID=3418665 RepID=UPI003EE631DB
MKKINRTLVLGLVMILTTSLFFVGCIGESKQADKVAEAIYDLFILEDSTKIEGIGFSKEEVEKSNMTKAIYMEESKKELEGEKLIVTDEELETLYVVLKERLKKLTVTTEIISEDKETTVVKVKTTFLYLKDAAIEAGEYTLKEAQNVEAISESDYYNKISNIYISKYIDNIKILEPSVAVKEKTFEFEKQYVKNEDNTIKLWVPKDAKEFGEVTMQMCLGI